MLIKCPHCEIYVTVVIFGCDYRCSICGTVIDVEDDEE